MKDEERIGEVFADNSEERISAERRDFLKKCGRFAAYAAPAMMLLLSHNEHANASCTSCTT